MRDPLLHFAVLLFAQERPPIRGGCSPGRPFQGGIRSRPRLVWLVGQTWTPDFLAFVLDRIREALKVPSMVKTELSAPKAMSCNCAGIPAGAPFVARASSPEVFGFLVSKSAEVWAAVGPFVPGSSADSSLSQSVGRLTLLPVSQRPNASNPPSAVLRLIRSISKTEGFTRSLLELAFQKVIDRDVLAA
jgi:hypothetical protein